MERTGDKQNPSVEEELAREEQKRKQLTSDAIIETNATQEISKAKETILKAMREILESGKNLERIEGFLQRQKALEKLGEGISGLLTTVDANAKEIDQVLADVEAMRTELHELNVRLDDELKKADEMRELERDTLNKLNQYLLNWL